MRRPSRTIITLAAPLLTLLAFGCKKAPSGTSYPMSGAAYDSDYENYDFEDGYIEEYDDGPVAQSEAAPADAGGDSVAMTDSEDAPELYEEAERMEADSAPPEPMAAPASMRAESRSRRSNRRSRRQARQSRKDRRSARKSKTSTALAGGAVAPTTATVNKSVAPPIAQPTPPPVHDREGYNQIVENDFIAVADDPRSTFSIDVDTASYSNMRRFIRDGRLPPADAVRIEELVNYFDYDYAQPAGEDPFSVATEVAPCPWAPDNRLVHVGLQGKDVGHREVPARNLVFLLDVSGSMNDSDKLPLLQRGLSRLASDIREQDRVSIVVYAGASGVVLEPTNDRRQIKRALGRLSAGGSTNGGAGIELAYSLATQNFVKGGINRVILATDGDFNVGVTSQGELTRLIERKRETGVFLSVLGFGRGNLQDSTMEQLADKGNGNYAYIDSDAEARKVLVEQAGATLMTIAKDVKIQVEFNPAEVSAYRLIGYENRKLAHRDFNDDTKDAGEIGAGHTVTALYEVVPVGRGTAPDVDPLKYQEQSNLSASSQNGELMTVKLRYKRPQGSTSKLLSVPVVDGDTPVADTSIDFRFSAAVAQFGLLLRGSKWRGDATWDSAFALAQSAQGIDKSGRRGELLELIREAAALRGHEIAVARRGKGPAVAE